MLPKQLMFTVRLIDQITKPIAKISKQFNGLASNYQSGTMKMASGVGGIAAAGYALQSALMPAIEMDRALGEVNSLGVRESALKELTDTATEFSLKYGKSATDFVRSSYDIQSAIGGLSDSDLSSFTLSSNVLAAATKADAATITDYMGSMYGIFKANAKNMGEGKWVQQLTGMTATAVKIFKTNGKKMSDAFGLFGASGGLAPLEEQMAVLGTLQASMSGGESATKYKAFLSGAEKAQKSLGLSFVDSQGKLLPTVDILRKLKGEFGDLNNAADISKVKKAFGSDQAVQGIQFLLKDIDGLQGSIDQLGKVKGMEQAEKMAAAMTDQSERLAQSWVAIRRSFGMAILPTFNEFASWLADLGSDVVWFTETFPNLTKYIGYAAVAILGLVAAGGLFTLMMGAGQMAMVAWGVAMIAKTAIITALTSGLTFLRGAMLAVNIAMYANPIGLIVAGIALAVAAVAGLIYYWDDLKATMGEWGWIKAISGVFSSVWGGIKNIFNSTLEWIIDKINLIPGVDIDLNSSGSNVSSVAAVAPVQNKAQPGGITQQISNANQQKSTSIGNVNVYPAKGETNFMNFVEMHG